MQEDLSQAGSLPINHNDRRKLMYLFKQCGPEMQSKQQRDKYIVFSNNAGASCIRK